MVANSTSFKPGNQAAKGCETSGRPRTLTPEPEELAKLGQEMLEWVIKNKPLHLQMWWMGEKGYTLSRWESMRDLPEFVEYKNKCMCLVSSNYIDGTINAPVAQRFLRHYFPEVKAEENEKILFEAQANKQQQSTLTPELDTKFQEVHNTLTQLQEQLKKPSH